MTALIALLRRDIQVALRIGGGALIGVLFFLIVVVLMPFAVGLTMSRTPLELVCLTKAVAHWLVAGLPLIVATPILGLLLNLDGDATMAVALTLLAGTPALTFTGMIGAALAVALRRGGLLLAVLVLPLSIPVLIFGVAASNAAVLEPAGFGAPLSILFALSLAGLVIGPLAAAASLRHGLD